MKGNGVKAIKGWRYYNHALIPSVAPHVNPDVSIFENLDVWKKQIWGGELQY